MNNPYPAYKPSGNSWLGDLPKHWDVRRLKYILRERDKRSILGREQLLRVSRYTGITERKRADGLDGPDTRAMSLVGYKCVRQHDLVINIMLAWNASLGVSPVEGIVSPAYCVYGFFTNAFPWFFHYLLRSPKYTAYIKSASTGVVDSRLRLYSDDLYQLYAPLPPLSEQRAIVRYLDHVDRRIRRYISAKQKLIDLLEEEKQAIINQAVTRGLDPNVRLNPSGVEWLGHVPEHWEVVRNGQLFVQRNEKRFPELPILEVSLRTGVTIRDFENLNRKQMMTVRGEYKRAVKGDIAYNMMRMWQGAVGVVPVDGLVSPAYVVAEPLRRTEPRYFCALFRTSAYMTEADKYSRGIVKDRNRLYWEDFKQMPTPCPPPHEQVLIADAIDQSMASLNDKAIRIRRQIELLQEYRTRLIADVVTGKLDMREAATRLPDVGDDGQDPIEENGPILDNMNDGSYDAGQPTDEEIAIESEVTV